MLGHAYRPISTIYGYQRCHVGPEVAQGDEGDGFAGLSEFRCIIYSSNGTILSEKLIEKREW